MSINYLFMMAEEVIPEGNPNENIHQELYIPVRTLGRGAFGEAVLYRKKEVELFTFFLFALLLFPLPSVKCG